MPDLHRAAAAWFQEHREPEAAVGHWLAAGDVASAMAAVRAARETGLIGGRGPGSARLLRQFSEEQILADPVADAVRRLDLRAPLGHSRRAEALGAPRVPHRGRRRSLTDGRVFPAVVPGPPPSLPGARRDQGDGARRGALRKAGDGPRARVVPACPEHARDRAVPRRPQWPGGGDARGSCGARAKGAGSRHRAQRALPAGRGRGRLGAGGGPRSPGDRGRIPNW